jgi:hypothetical protein
MNNTRNKNGQVNPTQPQSESADHLQANQAEANLNEAENKRGNEEPTSLDIERTFHDVFTC